MPIKYNTIQEIEEQIDYSNLRKFKYQELIGLGFVPLSMVGDMYNIVVIGENHKDEIRALMESRLEKHSAGYDFTQIREQEFKDLIGLVDEHFATDKEMAEIAANGYNIGFDEVYMGNNSAENSDNANYKVVNKGNYSVSVPVTEDSGVPQDASKKKIGEVLIEMGLITEEQLFDALVTSKKSGNPIGSVLVQKNYIEH